MIPDSVFNSNRFLWAASLCVIILLLLLPSTGKTAATMQRDAFGFCMTDSSDSVVYFSAIYDTKIKLPARIATNGIAREFIEYLMGRYNFKAGGNFPGACPNSGSFIEAEANKRNFETQARQLNRQIVEVDWKWSADDEMIAASLQNSEEDVFAQVARKRKPTHTYCVSDSAQGTLYTAGPIDTGTGVNLSFWYRGFSQHLRQKYSYTGEVFCNVGSPQEDARIMGARIAGARAAGKKIVDTGWKFDMIPVPATTLGSAQKDNDPEPVQRPAPVSPSRQASDDAAKEIPASTAYCQKDPALSLVFRCDSFARVVYNYRTAHANEAPEPVASLIASHKLNCAECIDNTRVSLWAENRANADKLSPKAVNCVSQNVIVTLYKTPEANRLTEFYKAAVAMCK